ncbi:hypothetical protein MMC16_005307 [Acarospora aff. strigata]|nr:hypothetical protein [Acarospora aff. strigata]
MAFRQSTHPQPQRQLTLTLPDEPLDASLSGTHAQRAVEESQEWVLFSPSLAPSTTRTHTTSTERTPRTAGLSRVSDFGSFNSAARSGEIHRDEAAELDLLEGDAEEDGELDSLDDGLHAFHEPSVHHADSGALDHSGGSILPTHDGLGTFPASCPPVQEQLWQFEQFNPRRKGEGHQRRRSSVQRRLDAAEDGQDIQLENDRRLRIEKWRMEQSRVLLDEIEKETRRRLTRSGEMRLSDAMDSGKGKKVATGASNSLVLEHSDPQDVSQSWTQEPEDTETFWQRITRRVIRDLIGIDDSILSVIFGESIPLENPPTAPRPSTTLSSQLSALPTDSIALTTAKSWEDRLFERIARELDLLVHQLSEHPGAFSTYLNTPQQHSDYAGIPITRASTPRPPTQNTAPYDSGNLDAVDFPQFNPTLQDANTSATHAALWGIEEEPPNAEEARAKFEREYWERELNVRTVFRFLRNRFTNNTYQASPGVAGTTSSNLATSNTQDTATRAAIIRQHHPLVSRTHDRQTRRISLLHHHHNHHHTLHSSSTSPLFAHLKRPGSSCASVSSKRSAKRGSGSSRNYWDIGGSVGSGSAIAATGGMGFWGEV